MNHFVGAVMAVGVGVAFYGLHCFASGFGVVPSLYFGLSGTCLVILSSICVEFE